MAKVSGNTKLAYKERLREKIRDYRNDKKLIDIGSFSPALVRIRFVGILEEIRFERDGKPYFIDNGVPIADEDANTLCRLAFCLRKCVLAGMAKSAPLDATPFGLLEYMDNVLPPRPKKLRRRSRQYDSIKTEAGKSRSYSKLSLARATRLYGEFAGPYETQPYLLPLSGTDKEVLIRLGNIEQQFEYLHGYARRVNAGQYLTPDDYAFLSVLAESLMEGIFTGYRLGQIKKPERARFGQLWLPLNNKPL